SRVEQYRSMTDSTTTGAQGGYRVLAIHAHPDDESSKGAATMARYIDEGHRVRVLTCTGGEEGSILNPRMDRPRCTKTWWTCAGRKWPAPQRSWGWST